MNAVAEAIRSTLAHHGLSMSASDVLRLAQRASRLPEKQRPAYVSHQIETLAQPIPNAGKGGK